MIDTEKKPQKLGKPPYSWSDLPSTMIKREFWGPGWLKQHDLAVEAHEATGLKFEWWRDMISACYGGLPIWLTYMETKRCCIIEQIMSYSSGTTANMYIRSWGFAYPISYKALTDVEVPKTEFLNWDTTTDPWTPK